MTLRKGFISTAVRTVKIHLQCFTQIVTLRMGSVAESHVNFLKSGLVRVRKATGKKLIPLFTVKAEYNKAEMVLWENFYADKEYCSNMPKYTLEEYVDAGDQIGDESDGDESDGDNSEVSEDVSMGSDMYPPEKKSTLLLENGNKVEFVGKFIHKINKEDNDIFYCTYGKQRGACFGYHIPKNIEDVTNEQ